MSQSHPRSTFVQLRVTTQNETFWVRFEHSASFFPTSVHIDNVTVKAFPLRGRWVLLSKTRMRCSRKAALLLCLLVARHLISHLTVTASPPRGSLSKST